MGAPSGAPVNPRSTISSTALTYEESSDARKSTALATSSGSPQRPCGREELLQLSGIFCGSSGARPALPNGSFDRAWCDDVHANVARCKVGGDGTRHRDETTLGGCICGDTRLAEIVMYRPSENDAAVVVQQRRR